MLYNKQVTLSNGSQFMAKDVNIYECPEDPDNSRVAITVDDATYDDILLVLKDGDINYVKVEEYESIKVNGKYTTGDKIGEVMYDDYGVNALVAYNLSSDEYTIELYKITDLVKASRDQYNRIVDTSMGIIDVFEYNISKGDN